MSMDISRNDAFADDEWRDRAEAEWARLTPAERAELDEDWAIQGKTSAVRVLHTHELAANTQPHSLDAAAERRAMVDRAAHDTVELRLAAAHAIDDYNDRILAGMGSVGARRAAIESAVSEHRPFVPATLANARARAGAPERAPADPVLAREFIEGQVEKRSIEINHHVLNGEFDLASASALQLSATLQAHGRERTLDQASDFDLSR